MLIVVEKVYKCNDLNIVKYALGYLPYVFIHIIYYKMLIILQFTMYTILTNPLIPHLNCYISINMN